MIPISRAPSAPKWSSKDQTRSEVRDEINANKECDGYEDKSIKCGAPASVREMAAEFAQPRQRQNYVQSAAQIRPQISD